MGFINNNRWILLLFLLAIPHAHAASNTAHGINVPDAETIKRDGQSSSFDAKPNQLWEATILVVMQKATLMQISTDTGLLVAPPYLLLIDNKDKVTVYSYFLDNVVQGLEIDSKDRQFILDSLLAQIATQLKSAENLRPGGRWSFLH